MFVFPKNFYWGAATSAHQVEGNNHNDWTEFERLNAKRQTLNATLRQAQGKPWPDFILQKYPNPLQEENYISGRACDHYNRFREDFDIAKSLGHNAHRFSIEWSRIEPEEGKFDEKEIEHYREIIKALRERGMEPFVTLWHWTLPIWVAKGGGWENRETVKRFVLYCERMALEFKDDVNFWIVINEPGLVLSDGYIFGKKNPAVKNIFRFLRAYRNCMHAQVEAYRVMKKVHTDFQVGLAESAEWTEYMILPWPFRKLALRMRNFILPKHFHSSTDFIGVNFYRRNRLWAPPENKISDMGWEMYPEGLFLILTSVWKRFHIPIMVTENGIADARDAMREKFIREHIAAMKKAMDEGVDVRGYFHWSLLDNFEWENGFWPRFGLVEVDYKTFARKIRQSALVYKKIIEESVA